ncbi:MAG: membrane dipeptidase [Eubacteriales bacterium]|nr:membrane dipeptidase [Eubacteriales bacterium]
MLICDCHADTLYALANGSAPDSCDVTYDRLMAGGHTRVQALALWTGVHGLKQEDEGLTERELAQLERLKAQGFRQITRVEDALPDAPNALLTVEGGEVFGQDVERVDAFADLGVRIAALLWNNVNPIGFPACGGSDEGLTDFGRRVVARMNRRHMAVDVSHLNDAGVRDALSCGAAPLMATHSCCRALCPHPRNLTDDQLKAIFAGGGFVGVNFFPSFLSPDGKASIDTVIDHMDRMTALGGEGHIGLGSDFDGIETHPAGLRHAGDVPALLARLRERGYTQTDVENIAGLNFKRFMQRIDASNKTA